MMNANPQTMTRSRRMAALALLCAPLAAPALQAQHSTGSAAKVCAGSRCADDTSHVLVIRLQDRMDSLQQLFLGRPLSLDQRERVKAQIEDLVERLTSLQANAVALGLQSANEGIREAMHAAQQQMLEADAASSAASKAMADVAPKGWIGLTFVGAPLTRVRDGEIYVQFLDYPEVESVDPASPAEQAGVLRGDLLLAFNGQDVTTKPISMTRLLRPNHKIVVRLERDGTPHNYTMTVARAPRSYAVRIGNFAPAPVAPPAPSAAVAAPAVPASPPRAVIIRGQGQPDGQWVTGFSYSLDNGVAGAEMNTLNGDLARNLNLGVDHGVMVLKAPDGTPAARSGLRAGDIIVRAAGQDIGSVRDFRRVLERHSGEPSVEIQIVRDHHKKTLRFDND